MLHKAPPLEFEVDQKAPWTVSVAKALAQEARRLKEQARAGREPKEKQKEMSLCDDEKPKKYSQYLSRRGKKHRLCYKKNLRNISLKYDLGPYKILLVANDREILIREFERHDMAENCFAVFCREAESRRGNNLIVSVEAENRDGIVTHSYAIKALPPGVRLRSVATSQAAKKRAFEEAAEVLYNVPITQFTRKIDSSALAEN